MRGQNIGLLFKELKFSMVLDGKMQMCVQSVLKIASRMEIKMPNRVIRDGFLDSEKINSLNEQEQNFFIRLLLIADDYGRFDARPELIKSKCYPVTDKRPSIVSTMLTKLSDVGLIVLYTVDGKNYLEINEYNQRLRQKREKYPKPKIGNAVKCLSDVSKLSVETNPIRNESESEEETNPNHKSDFDIAFNHFKEMRKKIKKPMTQRAEELILNELNKIAPDDIDKQIKILNESTMKDWQGVFPLKDDKKRYGII